MTCLGTNRVVELDARAADPNSAERRRFPVVSVGPADDAPETPPTTLPPGDAGDLVSLKVGGGARLSIRGFEAGVISMGKQTPVAKGR